MAAPEFPDEFPQRFSVSLERAVANGKMAWPSIPDVLLRIREAVVHPSSDARRVADAVGTDAVLTARFIRMANSAYYGTSHPCHDLREAVVRLGQGAVEQVATMLVVSRVFAVGRRKRIKWHLRRLWLHSTEVAALSRAMAAPNTGLKPDVAALAGLIHDVGTVPVLVHAESMGALLENRAIMEPLVFELHDQLGPMVLHDWNFPATLMRVISGHEDLVDDQGSRPDYVDLVRIANRLSRTDLDDSDQTVALCALPSAQKLGLDVEALPEIVARGQTLADELQQILP